MSSPARAEVTCKPLLGHFESEVVTNFDPNDPDACASPIGFCTDGMVIGGLQESFRLTVGSFIPVEALPGVDSPVAFFVGESVITIKNSGDQLVGTDTGALNQANGQITTLLTFTEGTGRFAGAAGQIGHIRHRQRRDRHQQEQGPSGPYRARQAWVRRNRPRVARAWRMRTPALV